MQNVAAKLIELGLAPGAGQTHLPQGEHVTTRDGGTGMEGEPTGDTTLHANPTYRA